MQRVFVGDGVLEIARALMIPKSSASRMWWKRSKSGWGTATVAHSLTTAHTWQAGRLIKNTYFHDNYVDTTTLYTRKYLEGYERDSSVLSESVPEAKKAKESGLVNVWCQSYRTAVAIQEIKGSRSRKSAHQNN
jgi:hypothetical protein